MMKYKLLINLFGLVLLCTQVAAQNEDITDYLKSTQELTLEGANKIIEQTKNYAKEKNIAVVIVVTDKNSDIIALQRMNGAALGAIDIAIKKAKTAVLFKSTSSEIGALAQPGGPIYTLENSNGGLISFAGGVSLKFEGEVVGAIGVAGASVEQDEELALYGLKVFE